MNTSHIVLLPVSPSTGRHINRLGRAGHCTKIGKLLTLVIISLHFSCLSQRALITQRSFETNVCRQHPLVVIADIGENVRTEYSTMELFIQHFCAKVTIQEVNLLPDAKLLSSINPGKVVSRAFFIIVKIKLQCYNQL